MTANSRLSVVALVTLGLALAQASAAQVWRGKGRASGTVTDVDGKPVAGATVTLRMQEKPDEGPPPVVTDKYGKWSVLGLVLANWTIHIEAEGFDPSDGATRVNEYGTNAPIETKMYPVSVDPALAEAAARVDEGNQLLRAEKPAEARALYEAALPKLTGANRTMVLKRIALCQTLEGNDEAAVRTLETAIAEAPDDVEALRQMIDRLVVLKRPDEAALYTARLPQGQGLDANTLLNMGINLYNETKYVEAQAKFDEIVAAKPEWADAYYYRGLNLLGMGEMARAKADFEKVLALDPNHPYAGECREFLKSL